MHIHTHTHVQKQRTHTAERKKQLNYAHVGRRPFSTASTAAASSAFASSSCSFFVSFQSTFRILHFKPDITKWPLDWLCAQPYIIALPQSWLCAHSFSPSVFFSLSSLLLKITSKEVRNIYIFFRGLSVKKEQISSQSLPEVSASISKEMRVSTRFEFIENCMRLIRYLTFFHVWRFKTKSAAHFLALYHIYLALLLIITEYSPCRATLLLNLDFAAVAAKCNYQKVLTICQAQPGQSAGEIPKKEKATKQLENG